ncbi:MAG: ATP-binding protein, partial [Desulfobacteraceae bacterium]|nr:ATP-binding protein [Desulfobacteraceae bacterium]
MKKYFNIAGPCNPDKHYMISSSSRCGGITDLIEQEQYFVIHAARQSGKTTLLKELTNRINRQGRYYALYCSLESVQGIIEPEKGIPAIIYAVRTAAEYHPYLPVKQFAEDQNLNEFNVALRKSLTEFCLKSDKPLLIFFDEADCLSNGTLITFLRQIRDGYINRDMIPFVHSVGLIGMRNIRDYKGKIREERETLGSASPFNIVTKAMTLQNFTEDEIAMLYAQHTEATGQIFSPEVIGTVYHQTQGQPWLVNAVASEIVTEILGSDYSKSVVPEHVAQAIETIIRRRDTHIDSLMERLKEERVRKIVEPVLTGEEKGFDFTDDDYQYVLDLGLIKNIRGVLMPSNPIYADVIVRKLSSESRMRMDSAGFPPEAPAYLENGILSMKRLLTDFQQFWRENSAIWEERFFYKEAAPHLILTAFLQRIINSGGRIDRELATGRKRLDLCIHYQNRRYPIEIKSVRARKPTMKERSSLRVIWIRSAAMRAGWSYSTEGKSSHGKAGCSGKQTEQTTGLFILSDVRNFGSRSGMTDNFPAIRNPEMNFRAIMGRPYGTWRCQSELYYYRNFFMIL